MAEIWENMPELSPPLIENVLRQGHKMLLAGPSKAGKSFALIELCIAMAEGRKWMGWQCTKGKVLYVNLELDKASCDHRIHDVYTTLQIPPVNIRNIEVWHLRGVTEPMDKLAPKLIRRAKKQNFIAVIIDPIYKVITGDENSADQMAHFCNQFDKVCTQLGCAVIYCHHHSKGAQGGKRSMDHASGSGVFARDPDALIDMTELELTDEILKQETNTAICEACIEKLRQHAPAVLADAAPDELLSHVESLKLCWDNLPPAVYEGFLGEIEAVKRTVRQRTAWRLDGTPGVPEVRAEEPVVSVSCTCGGHCGRAERPAGREMPPHQRGAKRGGEGKRRTEKAKNADKRAELLNTFDACNIDGQVTVKDMAEYLGVEEKTIRNRIKRCDDFTVENSIITKKKAE